MLSCKLLKTWKLTFNFSELVSEAKPVFILLTYLCTLLTYLFYLLTTSTVFILFTLTLSYVFDICYHCHNLSNKVRLQARS